MRAPLVIATVAFLLTSFTTSRVASAQNPQVIVDWNQALLTSLGTPGVAEPTVFFTRPLALLHVAIFDAVNTFDRTYTPYIAFVDVPSDASRDVAAAASAHAVLSEMYPSQRQVYDALVNAVIYRRTNPRTLDKLRTALCRLIDYNKAAARRVAA